VKQVKVLWRADLWYNKLIKIWFVPRVIAVTGGRDDRIGGSAMSDIVPQNVVQCMFNFEELNSHPIELPHKVIPPSIPQRYCKDCEKFFPATKDFFYANKARKDGWTTQCIPCRSKYMSARYALKHPKPEKPIPPAGHKFCTKCDQPKPLEPSFWGYNPQSKSKLTSICRECLYKIDTERLHRKHENNPPVFSEEVLKKCSACEKEFPSTPEYFHLNKRKQDGLDIECKPCKSKRCKEYRLANPDRDQWQKFMYRDANRESIREKGRAYAIAHRAEHNASHRKRMANLEQNGGTLTARDIQNQHDQQKGKCYWCHKKLEKYHVDHVIPIIRGGSNDPSNIVIACPFCNISKGSKTVEEWLAYLEKFILSKDPDEWIDSDDIVS
jgi:hypothetical protein